MIAINPAKMYDTNAAGPALYRAIVPVNTKIVPPTIAAKLKINNQFLCNFYLDNISRNKCESRYNDL